MSDIPVSPDATIALVKGVVIPFLFKLAGAFALWIVGGWLIRFALKFLRRSLQSGGRLDASLVGYLVNILGALLKVVLVVAILGFFGIQTASFAALLAGAGVAIGVAWGGMLGDFAAGLFLQIFRPFGVGDFVEAGGITGTVDEVGIFVSAVNTPDNVRKIIPNNKIFGDIITNYSAHPYRRVELVAQLDNTADVEKAIQFLKEGMRDVPHQYPGMPADVEVLEFSERGPRLAVRPYTNTDTYWDVYFATNRKIVVVLSANGFPVPRIPMQISDSRPSA
ncbi:MAG: mechanosensitive ion channel family protein [Synechococcaceae cyanobacterium]